MNENFFQGYLKFNRQTHALDDKSLLYTKHTQRYQILKLYTSGSNTSQSSKCFPASSKDLRTSDKGN